MTDDFWIVRDDVGIKCFPRVGSTTILLTYGYGQSCVRFMTASRKYVVVRNPYDRLLSAYALYQNRRYGDVPKIITLNDLLGYILKRTDEERDIHVRSMTAQLQGYEPKEGEVVELKDFLANPVLKIAPNHLRLHRNQTGRRPDTGEIDNGMLEEYLKQYLPDIELWKRAQTR